MQTTALLLGVLVPISGCEDTPRHQTGDRKYDQTQAPASATGDSPTGQSSATTTSATAVATPASPNSDRPATAQRQPAAETESRDVDAGTAHLFDAAVVVAESAVPADVIWERDHEDDIMALGRALEQGNLNALTGETDAAAMRELIDTCIMVDWGTMGLSHSADNPLYRTFIREPDQMPSFSRPRTDPLSLYLHAQLLLHNERPDDDEAGAILMLRSADTGFSTAQTQAALLLMHADGPLSVDAPRALAYAEAASAQGDPTGDYVRALAHMRADSDALSAERAWGALEGAAELGLPAAATVAAIQLSDGRDTPDDNPRRAIRLLLTPAEQNSTLALRMLTELYATDEADYENPLLAWVNLKVAESLGDPNAGEVAEHHWRRMLREAMRENARTRLAERLEQVTELPVGAWRDQWAEQRMALRQSYQRAREASNVRPSQR